MSFKIATVCSGIGSPEMAVKKHPHEIIFACEYDKYARASYTAINGPTTMYNDMTKEEWDLPSQYSDLFIGGIPCQAFSLAGKRLGELDPRGLLFFDFYRYVKNQLPKVFIIENVKGLLSDNKGRTFQNWLHLLGDSVNGHSQMFTHPDSLGYNLHHTVLNSKNFGVPQNRERVFIVGIRSDLPNSFRFPVGWKLDKRLKDVLETFETSRFNTREEFDSYMKKYYLSDKMIESFTLHKEKHDGKGTGFGFKPKTLYSIANCIRANASLCPTDNMLIVGDLNKGGERGVVYSDETRIMSCLSATDYKQPKQIMVSEALSPTIDIGAGRWSVTEPTLNKVMQLFGSHEATGRVYDDNGLCPTITAKQGGGHEPKTYTQSRIRRLTPLECWRMQGFTDEAFYKAKEVNSDSQLYKQAGNSMTVNVMEAIIDNLIPIINVTKP